MLFTRNRQFGVCLLLMVVLSSCAWGQQTTSKKSESTRYRKILTLAGLGGGFVVGTFVGLDAFDQAINSEQKVFFTAFAAAAAGAVGGYFLGRAIDKSKSQVTWLWVPDELDRSLMRTRSLAYGWPTTPVPSLVGERGLDHELSLRELGRTRINQDRPQRSEELKHRVTTHQ